VAQRVLVDTDVLVDVAPGNQAATEVLRRLEADARLATSIIARMELVVGCRNKRDLESLEQFVRRFDVVGLREDTGNLAADLLVQYRLSHGLLIPDALIAATAILGGFALLTRNVRHYRFITQLGLAAWPHVAADS